MANQTFDDFKAHILKHGVAETSRWEIVIPLPLKLQQYANTILGGQQKSLISTFIKSDLTQNASDMNRSLHIMANTTSFPGTNIDTIAAKHSGISRIYSYSKSHDILDIGFMVGESMAEKKVFDMWNRMIVDPNTRRVSYYDSYVADITIKQLNKQNTVTYTATITEAFPTVVTPMGLDRGANNINHTLQVSFAYNDVKPPDEITTTDSTATPSITQNPIDWAKNKIGDNAIANAVLSRAEAWANTEKGKYMNLVHNKIKDAVSSDLTDQILGSSVIDLEINDVLSGSDKLDITGSINSIRGV